MLQFEDVKKIVSDLYRLEILIICSISLLGPASLLCHYFVRNVK
jgi:hypothetical protein